MLLLQITLCLLFGLAYCQFNFMGSDDFFGQMFGGGQQQHQQQRPSGSSQWAAHAESVQCSQYLCPDTLDCVGTPSACPCPNEQDIKCLIPDALDKAGATVMCVRGNTECEEVNRLMKKYNK